MSEAPPSPPAPEASAPQRTGRKRRFLKRATRRGLLLSAALLCGLLVSFVSVDIGNLFSLRQRAEKAGTNYLQGRPMHIGRIRAYLRLGHFEVDDLRIDGLNPGDRPFVTAKSITCDLQWLPLIHGMVVLEVRMSDWKMLVEQWANGAVSMPKLGSGKPSKPIPVQVRLTSFYGQRGEFAYEDHGTPWSVVAPNLDVSIVWADMYKKYVGTARFSNGSTKILTFLPMRTDLAARFSVEGGKPVQITGMELTTDGAVSRLTGVVDFAHWPEQTYQVTSRISFPRMRDLFFANETWRFSGDGDFRGQFHLFSGGRQLDGEFTSPNAALHTSAYDFQFPGLRGSLIWTRDRFEVTKALCNCYGGSASLVYKIAPLNVPGGATATFTSTYQNVDAAALAPVFHWQRIALDGTATGHHDMTWLNGHWHDTVHGDGAVTVTPPAGETLATPDLPTPEVVVEPLPAAQLTQPLGRLATGGAMAYQFDSTGMDLAPSWAASRTTYAAFRGRFDWHGAVNMPVDITSRDWQASDRLLAAILTERGAPTRVIEVGGRGTFHGVLTDTFSALRVSGRFAGESIYSWGNRWGRTTGDIVMVNNTVTVTNGVVGDTPDSRIGINGTFSLSGDGQMSADVQVDKWPLEDFKRAFRQSDWPVSGTGTATLSLKGPYTRLVGTGTLRVDNGVAWKEPFETATGKLLFEGTDLRINPLEISKGKGTVRGDLVIRWDNTYSFDADGVGIHVDSISNFALPSSPLTGLLSFTARGAGSFTAPTYEFDGRVADLFIGPEAIGNVSGSLIVANNVVSIRQMEASSVGLIASGHGTIAFDGKYTSDLTLNFSNTQFDPYFKFFTSQDWLQYTRLVADGTVRIRGPLSDRAKLDVTARVDDAKLTLFDYVLQSAEPMFLTYQRNAFSIGQPGCTDVALSTCSIRLTGSDTELRLSGNMAPNGDLLLDMDGTASLAILRALKGLGDVTASGNAVLHARVAGTTAEPLFSGNADLKSASVKFGFLPRTVRDLAGRITFDRTGVNFDGLRGKMADGDVTFAGSIGFRGLKPDEFNLTMTGTGVLLAGYPRGFDSTVDAVLALRGPFASPTLSGDVTVDRVRFERAIETDVGLLAIAGGGGGAPAPVAIDSAVPADEGTTVQLDVHIHAAPMKLIDSKDLSLTGAADDLILRGTSAKPALIGRIDVLDGLLYFNGNRFRIGAGTVDFSNPNKFDPVFNLSAETQARTPGQTFLVTLRLNGTLDKIQPTLVSEPSLPELDIYALLLGGSPDLKTVEARSLRSPSTAQAALMATLTAQLLTAKTGVATLVEKTGVFDTVQLVPTLLGPDLSAGSLNATARVTLVKRISDRIFFVYSRDLNSPTPSLSEFILVQFDQSDRVSWVLSRNEDQSLALDFRIRHIF